MWDRRGGLSDAAQPLAAIYSALTWLKASLAPEPFRAPAPVICVGSVLVGGSCKTPVALDLAERLGAHRQGMRVHILTRGYGGAEIGPLRVRPGEHAARDVGDEALLHACVAPTWVGARRSDSAAAACAAGAELLIMDDGLQHDSLHIDAGLLCLDASYLLGNGRVLPAGPLREPFHRTLARSAAVIAVTTDTPAEGGGCDEDDSALRARLELPPGLPLLRATLEPEPSSADAIRGKRVLPFSGTARPERFFRTLRSLGCSIGSEACALPDHAPLPDDLLERLRARAEAEGALLATTSKDAARLLPAQREGIHVLRVRLRWREADGPRLDNLLANLSANRST